MIVRDERRPEAGLRRKAVVLTSVLLLIALVVGSMFGDRGILHLITQRQRADALRLEIEALRDENLRLYAEIRELRTDPRAVERLAREELGLARPGETLFLLRQAPDRP
jgi:cell division protein FtsB